MFRCQIWYTTKLETVQNALKLVLLYFYILPEIVVGIIFHLSTFIEFLYPHIREFLSEEKTHTLFPSKQAEELNVICYYQNLHWKLERLTPSFGSNLAVRLKKYFF